MTAPSRLTLSRAKGFNLQAASLALNGLTAVSVARPTKWGNPWLVENFGAHKAVAVFSTWLNNHTVNDFYGPERAVALKARRDRILTNLPSMRGKNLACWCKQSQPCHADVLLKLANAPICQEVK